MAGAMETFPSFEPSPQEKAIRNSLIFDCILSKMDLDGLKLLRRVCKSWELAANSEMLKRPGNRVEFKYDYESRRYKFLQSPVLQQEGKKKKKQKYLSDLNKILKTSRSFPCRYFVFQYGKMDRPTCKNLFAIQGKQIETLVMHGVFISKDKFIRMVNEEMPNLKKLSFVLDLQYQCSEEKVRDWEMIQVQDIQFNLLSLEILHIDCPDDGYVGGHLAKQMMYGAPKLKSVGNITLRGTREHPEDYWAKATGFKPIGGQFWEDKAHVIKECVILPRPTVLDYLERFIKARPMLTIVTILSCGGIYDFKNPPMMQLIAQLLQTCSGTLKKLETDSISILPINFVMSSLTKLYWRDTISDGPFPATIFAEFFPRLEFIRFDFRGGDYTPQIIEDYFKMAADSPSLTSVKNLHFYGGLSGSAVILPGINSLFPTLINLSLDYAGLYGESYVSTVFEKLEKLKCMNFSKHTKVSKEEWFKAVSDGKAKDLLKLAVDTNIFGLDYPLKEPEIFQF